MILAQAWITGAHAQTIQEPLNKINKDIEIEKKATWNVHKSISKNFQVYFPQDYAFKVFPFQFNGEDIAMSTEIIFPRPEEKEQYGSLTYLVKTAQTFGRPLNDQGIETVLARETEKYKAHAKEAGATIVSHNDLEFDGFKGKKLFLVYESTEGANALRIAYYVTAYSIITQLISGPQADIFSYRADEFFNSLTPFEGRIQQKNPPGVGWVEYPSKAQMFTAVLPPETQSYTPDPPQFLYKGGMDAMRFMIQDPLILKKSAFLAFAYKLNAPATPQQAYQLFMSKHLSKYIKGETKRVDFETANYKDGTILMRARIPIPPPSYLLNATNLITEIRIKDNAILVQEFLCSSDHVNSGLDKTLFGLLKFHPEKHSVPN